MTIALFSPLLAQVDPSWLFLAGVAFLTTALVRMTYRRRGSRRAGGTLRESANSSPLSPSSRELLQKLEGKEVEFNDLAREALARLDNKIAILQRLLADAESTIARLQRTVAERDPCESVDAENSPSPRFPVSPCP